MGVRNDRNVTTTTTRVFFTPLFARFENGFFQLYRNNPLVGKEAPPRYMGRVCMYVSVCACTKFDKSQWRMDGSLS